MMWILIFKHHNIRYSPNYLDFCPASCYNHGSKGGGNYETTYDLRSYRG